MKCLNITPGLVRGLNYYNKCALAKYLQVINPAAVQIIGSICLDDNDNIILIDAYVENA